MASNNNPTSKYRKKIIIVLIIAFSGFMCFSGKFYIIALYKTLTFKIVKAGDKLYFEGASEEAGSSMYIPLYHLARLKKPTEIDNMNLSIEEKSKLKNQLKTLKGLKIFDSGAAFTGELVIRQKIEYLGECLDTLSTTDKININEIKPNYKIVNLKFNNPEPIPENYTLVNNNYYTKSYGCCLVVK